MKRLFDIICSLLGILIFLPLIVIIAIFVKIDSSGTVLFIQSRVGRNLRPFNLYKFRTMVMNAHKQGLSFTASGDPRITKIGKVLRKTKLDELPQLFNVLKGDMSIVGPRPLVGKYVNDYRNDFTDILQMRPGITDISSLTHIDEEADLKDKSNPEEYYVNVILKEKIKLAKEYKKRSSIIFDLKLILFTLIRLVYQLLLNEKMVNFTLAYRRLVIISTHLIVFVTSCYLAFFIRFEGGIPATQINIFIKYLPVLVLFRIILLYIFSLDKGMWRYANTKDILNIVMATSISSILFFLSVRYCFGEVSYSKSILVMDWHFNIFLLSQLRMVKLILRKINTRLKAYADKRVIIVGAGEGAEMLLRNIERNHLYPYNVIGLVDDNPYMKGIKIRNVPVLGSREKLRLIIQNKKIDEIIIAIPSLSKSKFNEIVKGIKQYGLPVKSLICLWSVTNGSGSFNEIREVGEAISY